jgi:hypothetical protein
MLLVAGASSVGPAAPPSQAGVNCPAGSLAQRANHRRAAGRHREVAGNSQPPLREADKTFMDTERVRGLLACPEMLRKRVACVQAWGGQLSAAVARGHAGDCPPCIRSTVKTCTHFYQCTMRWQPCTRLLHTCSFERHPSPSSVARLAKPSDRPDSLAERLLLPASSRPERQANATGALPSSARACRLVAQHHRDQARLATAVTVAISFCTSIPMLPLPSGGRGFARMGGGCCHLQLKRGEQEMCGRSCLRGSSAIMLREWA